jgi:hypothetical protein
VTDHTKEVVGREAGQRALPVAALNLPVSHSLIFAALYLDPQTKALLLALARKQDQQAGYANGDLAKELLESEHIRFSRDGISPPKRAVIQRLALVGKMFELVARDRDLPTDFRRGFVSLRFPLIKSALADSNFFTQRGHPLRTIVGELLQKAVCVRLHGAGEERQLDRLLQEAARDFDLSAAFVRPALPKLKPLTADIIEKFLTQLLEERKEREARRQQHARAIVGRLIESRLLGNPLPPLLKFLIDEEWSIVLARRLLRQGTEGEAWQDGLKCLDEIIEHAPAAAAGTPIPDALMRRIEAGLHEAGKPQRSSILVLGGLRRLTAWLLAREPVVPAEAPSLETPAAPVETAAVEAAVSAPQAETAQPVVERAAEVDSPAPPIPEVSDKAIATASLAALMRAGRWFRVYDHQQQRMRWLKLEAYYPAQNSMVFADFDGASPLGVQADQFVDDLRQGLSAPTNPDDETRTILMQLLQAPTTRAM